MCFAPQRRALFRHLNFQKYSRNMVCFVHVDFDMCFAPQRCALFHHLNFQKWSEHGVFCTFWLRHVLRATTMRTFSSSQLPKVVRTWCVLYILTSKRASRHNGLQFFIISTSKSCPRLACFVHFALDMCLEPQRRALFHLSSGQLAHKSFDKHMQGFATFLLFRAPGSSFFWGFLFFDRLSSSLLFFFSSLLFSSLLFSNSSHLCFSSVHIVGSMTSRLPSITTLFVYTHIIWWYVYIYMNIYTVWYKKINIRTCMMSYYTVWKWVAWGTLWAGQVFPCLYPITALRPVLTSNNSGGLLLDGTLGIFQSHYIYTWTDYVYIYILYDLTSYNIIQDFIVCIRLYAHVYFLSP